MNDVVVVDTSLLVLLVVGSASRQYIASHRRLADYTEDDFDILVEIIARFAELVSVPHVLAEVSNLAAQIGGPARAAVRGKLRTLIATTIELPLPSRWGALRPDFDALGLTDAVILHLCAAAWSGLRPTLVTADSRLADRARSEGCSVIDYRRDVQGR